MKTWTITRLAREFALSRSTLLYYDRIGLLCPEERSEAGYRLYSERQVEKLRQICAYRATGLPLKEIARLLSGRRPAGTPEPLRQRLAEVSRTITGLRKQQQLIVAMLSGQSAADAAPLCDRQTLTAILRQTGLTDADLQRFHAHFEHSAPAAHRDLLSLLGFSPDEIDSLRQYFRNLASGKKN